MEANMLTETMVEMDVRRMSLPQLAAMHPRQQKYGDLIPEGVSPTDTPEAYQRLHKTLEEFFLGQTE